MATSYIYYMIEKEITETYYFKPTDFNEKGRRISDCVTFRDVVKDFERDFHERHSTEYALNLYANSQTMDLLARSNDAAPFLLYGMAKQQGTNVCVYSETGSFMFNKTGNLVGYTSNTVTVKQGGTTCVYGEHGEIKFTK